MMTWVQAQVKLFASSIMFLTRLPAPRRLTIANPHVDHFAVYFPIVGIVVGGIAAAVYGATARLFPHDVAVALSMITTVFATGAFHEDGFADTCDGFGGGWTREQVLTIMKDSRIGTYGCVGIGMMLFLKFLLLKSLSPGLIMMTLIAGHAFSRAVPVALCYALPYARDVATKSDLKPVLHGVSFTQVLFSFAWGLLPLVLFPSAWFFLAVIPALLVAVYLGHYFKRRIGGYTGDCCGAMQQVCEVVFYATVLGMTWTST